MVSHVIAYYRRNANNNYINNESDWVITLNLRCTRGRSLAKRKFFDRLIAAVQKVS